MTRGELKFFTRVLVKLVGGVDAAAKVAGVKSSTTISNYGLPNHASTMPIHIVHALEADIGMPVISQQMAEAALGRPGKPAIEQTERSRRLVKELPEAIHAFMGTCPSLKKKEIMEAVVELQGAYSEADKPRLVVSNDAPVTPRLIPHKGGVA